MRILVFGDSIGYGAWDNQGGWVERLKQRAHEITLESNGETSVQVLNLCVGGDTSAKILDRLEQEINARLSASWPLCMIFSFGTNDERMIDTTSEIHISDFKQNIRQIISISQKFTDKILFVGSPPLPEDTVAHNKQRYSDELIKNYDIVLQQEVLNAKLDYVNTRALFEKVGKENLFCFDHLHPNTNGHALIEQMVAPKLSELTGIPLTGSR